MRKVLIILTFVFLVLSVIFIILPMGTIAYLPTALSLVFAVLAFLKSGKEKRKLPLWLMIVAVIFLLIVSGKVLFIKNKVVVDQQFKQEQIQSTQEAKQELEELEGLGEIDDLNDLESVEQTTDNSVATKEEPYNAELSDTTSTGQDDFGGGN